MARENFVNFATTTLNGTITSGASSFVVATGQGALFPSGNFLVSIDSEVIQVFTRSGDTFIVGAGGRGYDNTIAASHNSGVTVASDVSAFNFTHLWQNVADTYTPPVPPVQLGGSPSSYDNEFESTGSWTLFPGTPGAGTTWNAGTSLRSHLVLSRGSGDNALYTASIPYTATSAATFTCKLSEATSLLRSSFDQAQMDFFVSDQTNPTAGTDTGNRFKLQTVRGSFYGADPKLPGNTLIDSASAVRTVLDISGTATYLGFNVPIKPGSPVYLRLTYDGAGNWTSYVGDGVVYWTVATHNGLSTPQTLGVNFHIYNPSGQFVPQVAAIDYIRVVQGSVLPPFGG